MGQRLLRWANSHRLFLWLLGGLFFALEFLAHIPGPDSHWGEFLRHVGLVSGVAAVSSFVVDRYLKKQFAEDIAKDVASQVFVYGLPKEVAEEVDWARRLGAVRVNTRLSFSFSRVRHQGGDWDLEHIRLTRTVRFSIENRTEENFDFSHRCTLRHLTLWTDRCPFEVFECAEAEDVQGSGYRLGRDVAAARLPNGDWQALREVAVKPNKGNVKHTFVHKIVSYYRIEDSELFTFQQPTIGCEVIIDNNVPSLVITPMILHRLGTTNVKQFPAENPTEFKFEEAFLGPAVLALVWRKGPNKAGAH